MAKARRANRVLQNWSIADLLRSAHRLLRLWLPVQRRVWLPTTFAAFAQQALHAAHPFQQGSVAACPGHPEERGRLAWLGGADQH